MNRSRALILLLLVVTPLCAAGAAGRPVGLIIDSANIPSPVAFARFADVMVETLANSRQWEPTVLTEDSPLVRASGAPWPEAKDGWGEAEDTLRALLVATRLAEVLVVVPVPAALNTVDILWLQADQEGLRRLQLSTAGSNDSAYAALTNQLMTRLSQGFGAVSETPVAKPTAPVPATPSAPQTMVADSGAPAAATINRETTPVAVAAAQSGAPGGAVLTAPTGAAGTPAPSAQRPETTGTATVRPATEPLPTVTPAAPTVVATTPTPAVGGPVAAGPERPATPVAPLPTAPTGTPAAVDLSKPGVVAALPEAQPTTAPGTPRGAPTAQPAAETLQIAAPAAATPTLAPAPTTPSGPVATAPGTERPLAPAALPAPTASAPTAELPGPEVVAVRPVAPGAKPEAPAAVLPPALEPVKPEAPATPTVVTPPPPPVQPPASSVSAPARSQFLAAADKFLQEGDFTRSEDMLLRAQEAGDPKGEVYYAYARLEAARQNRAAERTWLERTLKEVPDHSTARLRLAEVLRAAGLWRKAVDEYNTVLKATPETVQAYLGLSAIYASQSQPRRAAEIIAEAIKHAPADASLYLRMGDLHAQRKARAEAEEAYDRAARLSQGEVRADALDRLGDLYVDAEREHEGFICYAEAAALRQKTTSAIADRRYQQIMAAADESLDKALRQAATALQSYLSGGEVTREEAFAAMNDFNGRAQEVSKFAESLTPPGAQKLRHAERKLTYSLASEAALYGLLYLDQARPGDLELYGTRLTDSAKRLETLRRARG